MFLLCQFTRGDRGTPVSDPSSFLSVWFQVPSRLGRVHKSFHRSCLGGRKGFAIPATGPPKEGRAVSQSGPKTEVPHQPGPGQCTPCLLGRTGTGVPPIPSPPPPGQEHDRGIPCKQYTSCCHSGALSSLNAIFVF